MNNEILNNLEPWFAKHNLGWLKERTVFLTMHGSHAYGTNIETSDIDLKGICLPPKEYYFGLKNKAFEQAESNEPYDMVIYDIRKFFSLAAAGNPNIIEVLFTDPKHWVVKSPIFERIHENKYAFLSKKVKFTFFGYAQSQLKRIETHKKWLLNPPSEAPSRKAFGLPEHSKMSVSELGATEKLIENNLPLEENVMKLFHKEMAYQNAKREWEQYQNWKKTRNPARAKLEAQYGYDCKHAGHLFRLMKMCEEILLEGEVHVLRPDKETILDIRNGKWTYDELISWTKEMHHKIEEAYKISPLPEKPNMDLLEEMSINIIESTL